MVGILLSYWDGLFSGAMLVSGRVIPKTAFLGHFGEIPLLFTTFGVTNRRKKVAMICPVAHFFGLDFWTKIVKIVQRIKLVGGFNPFKKY